MSHIALLSDRPFSGPVLQSYFVGRRVIQVPISMAALQLSRPDICQAYLVFWDCSDASLDPDIQQGLVQFGVLSRTLLISRCQSVRAVRALGFLGVIEPYIQEMASFRAHLSKQVLQP